MKFLPHNFEEKPYDLCLGCPHIGKRCDGPNFLAMDLPRLCEWCRLRKEYLHRQDTKWTNAFIAEESGISKVSVDRFLSGNVDDIKISTIARILKVLVNGSWGQYPCAMAAESETETALLEKAENAIAQCKHLQATLDGIRAEHKENLDAVRAEDQRKIDFLREQIKFKEEQMHTKDNLINEYNEHIKRKNRVIGLFAVLLGISVLLIIAALTIDVLDPNKGFFWLAETFGFTDGLKNLI